MKTALCTFLCLLAYRQRTTLLLTLFIIIIHPVTSENGNFQLGARAAGMAYTSATISDIWSGFNNIGGIGRMKNWAAGVAYENRFDLLAFHTMGAAMTAVSRWGNGGINFYRFGDELYSEQKLGLTYGYQVGFVSLGVQANYLQYNIKGLGTKGVFVFEWGGIAQIIPQLFFGAHIFNITQTKLADFEDERVPVIVKAGLSYRPIKSLMINIEAEKDLDYEVMMKAGIEFHIIQFLSLRTGISTKPFINYFGIGFKLKKWSADYALHTNTGLGLSHQVSMAYAFLQQR